MTRERDDKLRGFIKGDAARSDRLAAELRENLKRRKSQARALDREEPAPVETESEPSRRD